MKRAIWAVVAGVLLFAFPAAAQTVAPAQSTVNLSIGAQAFGLGGASQATPATDVTLQLNPGFSKILANLVLESHNILAPSADLQYYGGGVGFCVFGDCPRPIHKLPGVLAPLSLKIGANAGVARIVPAAGPSMGNVGYMAYGELGWTTGPGIHITVFSIGNCHFPKAPWGNNAPCMSGGIEKIFGSR